MQTPESAAGRSWRLLAEHSRTVAAFTARKDRRATLLSTAAEYEVKAGLEDERAEARRASRKPVLQVG